MVDKKFLVLEYLKGLLDDLWVVEASGNVLNIEYTPAGGIGQSSSITLTSGYYTTAELALHLKTLIDVAFTVGVNVAYNTTSHEWSIQAGEGDTIKYIDADSTAGDLLGFTVDQEAGTITSDSQVYKFIEYADYFPDSVQLIGNKYPAVLLRDGDEDLILPSSSLRIETDTIIVAYMYDNDIIDRIEKNLTLQRVVTDICLIDLTVGGNAIMISPVSVEKGDYGQEADKYNAGFYPNLTVRKIYFSVKNYDVRSQ